jgi:hypothetical protein
MLSIACNIPNFKRCLVLTALLLNMQVFLDATLRCWASDGHSFEGSSNPRKILGLTDP